MTSQDGGGSKVGRWLIGFATAVLVAVVAQVVAESFSDRRPTEVQATSQTMAEATTGTVASAESVAPAPEVATLSTEEPASMESAEPPSRQAGEFTEYRIEVRGTKLSADEWATEQPPGYYMKVFTAGGEIEHDDGCYAHLELYNNDVLLTTGDLKCGLKGGWSTDWWPNGTKLDPGVVRVTATITSDWGATAYTEVTYAVRDR